MGEENKPPVLQVIINELEKMYDFRYNTVKALIEFSDKDKNEFKEITERFVNSLVIEFKLRGLKTSVSEIEMLLNSDSVELYDPFKEYFNGLPKWDESIPSEIEKLAATIESTNQNYFLFCLRKWLMGMVACATKEGQVNQQMIVLSGRQGLGKSTWINKLLPKSLKSYCFSGTIKPGNKDTLVHLAETILIDLDELTNLGKRNTSSLKEIITKGGIKVRKAYARRNTDLDRRASFIGSINDTEFLYDLSGSRRFLCFQVSSIDYMHNIDIDLVYSEAMHLLEKGMNYFFGKEDIIKIEENNESFRVKSPMEVKLLDLYSPTCQKMNLPRPKGLDARGIPSLMRPTDIYIKIYRNIPSTGQASQLGKILRKHKFEYNRQYNGTYYSVHEYPPNKKV